MAYRTVRLGGSSDADRLELTLDGEQVHVDVGEPDSGSYAHARVALSELRWAVETLKPRRRYLPAWWPGGR